MSRPSINSTYRIPTRPGPSIRPTRSERMSIGPWRRLTSMAIFNSQKQMPIAETMVALPSWNNSNGADFFYTAGNAGNGSNPQPDGVDSRRGHADHQSRQCARKCADSLHSDSGRQFLRHGTRVAKAGQDREGRQLPRYYHLQQCAVLLQRQRRQWREHRLLPRHHRHCVPQVASAFLLASADSAHLSALAYNPATLQTTGLPNNMCILAGFPVDSEQDAQLTYAYPFGLWFANATTLYVADEGDGYTGGTDLYTHAAAQTTAGLQKWVFNSSTNTWNLAYTLQTGLRLGRALLYPALSDRHQRTVRFKSSKGPGREVWPFVAVEFLHGQRHFVHRFCAGVERSTNGCPRGAFWVTVCCRLRASSGMWLRMPSGLMYSR